MLEMDLKAYTTRAMELESAVYTQKKLMVEHQNLINAHRPLSPKRPNMSPPVKPIKPTDPIELTRACKILYVGQCALALLGCAVMFTVSVGVGLFFFIPCGCVIGYILSKYFKISEKYKDSTEQYRKDMNEYDNLFSQYQHTQQKAMNHYMHAYDEYIDKAEKYDKKGNGIMQEHAHVLASLEKALDDFYKQDVIFPKYRNMVAITTINEYLMSGRCLELEGPNGAYNLYETELRSNTIIDRMSSIISNLEEVRNNQFSLYQELQKANSTVNDVLHEIQGINDNTRLTAYFAGVTALIEASPKVYIGHSF